jgi:hypothetical protein
MVIRTQRMRSWAPRASSLAVVCALGVLSSAVAQTADRSFHFDITNQSLSQALRSFAHVCGQEVVFTEDMVAGQAIAYSAHCDRRFRLNVTGHSDGSALGGFLTPIGHVASTFPPFAGFSIFAHGVTRRAACRDSGRSSWRLMRAAQGTALTCDVSHFFSPVRRAWRL